MTPHGRLGLALAVGRRFYRHPAVTWFGGRWQRLVIWNRAVVRVATATGADLLEDPAFVPSVAAWFLRLAHMNLQISVENDLLVA